ncbi:hypothetical protein [Roseobacter denitrificans]|uniref:hypothetical protein n=1 Tax=Roseobacter denitrificans TaxID=2434 RepID=UPI0002EC0D07|nr:hypothetical protein [Roseobacter denitrificans]SFG36656.1 hypothetical protein SAMN05443635_114105 [Roseobacter denitrificans OCh 114]
MKTTSQTVKYPHLKGSEQHIPLKKQRDQEHVGDDAAKTAKLDEKVAKVVDNSEADTQIADELRDLAEKT